MINWMVFVLISSIAYAGIAEEVIIKGKIGNEFNPEKVKITDSLGQSYYLKTKYFPEGFQFKQGKEFTIEVPEEAMADVKIIK
jgi:hypothetical protein